MQNVQNQKWHIASWGVWGWIETAIKAVGIAAGFIAFFMSMGGTEFVLLGSPNLAAIIVLGLFTLITLAIIFLRFSQREVVSFIFSILNFLGHAGMLVALLRQPDQTTLALVFGGAYILGELAKQRFLSISGFTEAGQQTSGMVNFSRGAMGVYILFVVFILL